MNELSSLGLILLMALLIGRLARELKVPEVTGFILAGVAVGPSWLGWVNSDNLEALHVMSQVALGMILFSVGSALDLSHFRRSGSQILTVAATEAGLTGALVGICMLAVGVPWPTAMLLGCISMSTAPAATMMVLREHDSRGPLTDAIVAVVALNKVVVLAAFSVVATVITLANGIQGPQDAMAVIGQSSFALVWELAGSLALGYLVGLLLAGWGSTLTAHGEVQILLVGSVLFCIGASIALELSPLISSMAVGVTVVNLSRTSQRLAVALSRFDPPIYAVFFVIAGASIDVGRLTSLGVVGGAYILARGLGKILGCRLGCGRSRLPPPVGTLLGVSLLSLADLAVGLTVEVARRFPDLSDSVAPVVLAAVAVYETLGPLGTRFAILRSGEAVHGSQSAATEHAAVTEAGARALSSPQ